MVTCSKRENVRVTTEEADLIREIQVSLKIIIMNKAAFSKIGIHNIYDLTRYKGNIFYKLQKYKIKKGKNWDKIFFYPRSPFAFYLIPC